MHDLAQTSSYFVKQLPVYLTTQAKQSRGLSIRIVKTPLVAEASLFDVS